MKNRVTVTVRQSGREIVCTLSAVRVFFCFSKKFVVRGCFFEISVLVTVRGKFF